MITLGMLEVGQGYIVFPVEVPLAYSFSSLKHNPSFPLLLCVLKLWDICQFSESCDLLFLFCSLKEKSAALLFMPLGIQSSYHIILLCGAGNHRQGWWKQVGSWWGWVKPKLWAGTDCTFWHPDLASPAQPAHLHHMSSHLLSHSFPWEFAVFLTSSLHSSIILRPSERWCFWTRFKFLSHRVHI